MRGFIVILGLLIGLVFFVWMTAEGIPTTAKVEIQVQTTISNSKTSGCPETCKHPQETESEVSTTTESPSADGGEGALDKALDSDAGIALIRLAAALFVSSLWLSFWRLIGGFLRGSSSGPEEGEENAELDPGPGAGSGSDDLTEPPQPVKESEAARSKSWTL